MNLKQHPLSPHDASKLLDDAAGMASIEGNGVALMPLTKDGSSDDGGAQGEATTAPDDAADGESDGQGEGDEGPEVEEEHERQRPIRDPGQPTPAEVAEHDLTHIPFRPWCPACVKGKAKDKMSRRIQGDVAENLVPRVRLDYCFLTENLETVEGEHGEEDTTKAASTGTVLVMQESECRSIWAYAVEHKGGSENWVADQM